jgi:23S rRNA (uracil1939-C5)-methyltransferase
MKVVKQISLSIGDVVRIEVDRLAFGGEGVARHQGMVVFVPLAATGDVLDVKIVEIKKNFARASIVQIVRPSGDRREPPCQYYGQCGGCQLQHINYESQLQAKATFIRDSLRKIAGIDWQHEIEVKAATEFGYRSRAQLKLGDAAGPVRIGATYDSPNTDFAGQQDKRILVGFHRRNSHSVCDIEECAVLDPRLNSALAELRKSLNTAGSKGEFPTTIDLASGDSGVAANPPAAGIPAGSIARRIGPFNYRFSASTFFQANPSALWPVIESAVSDATGGLAIDLYAGVGLFTLPLGARFNKVIGVEASAESVAFAEANIAANGLGNIEFRRSRSEDWLREYADGVAAGRHESADFILLDPPRGGVEGAGRHLIRAAPSQICYVSCNPPTLSRDMARLIKNGYRLEKILGFDLFPQTYHVETIATLARSFST